MLQEQISNSGNVQNEIKNEWTEIKAEIEATNQILKEINEKLENIIENFSLKFGKQILTMNQEVEKQFLSENLDKMKEANRKKKIKYLQREQEKNRQNFFPFLSLSSLRPKSAYDFDIL